EGRLRAHQPIYGLDRGDNRDGGTLPVGWRKCLLDRIRKLRLDSDRERTFDTRRVDQERVRADVSSVGLEEVEAHPDAFVLVLVRQQRAHGASPLASRMAVRSRSVLLSDSGGSSTASNSNESIEASALTKAGGPSSDTRAAFLLVVRDTTDRY